MARKKSTATNSDSNSQSTDKLLQIVEYLASKAFPTRLQDISRDLGITQPTTLRYLNTLVNQNYAYQDESTMRYAITWRICRLSHQLMSSVGIRDVTAEYLRSLSLTFNVASCVSVRNEDGLLYLDVIYPGNNIYAIQRIGKNAPLHATASGRIFLSSLHSLQVERIASSRGFEAITPKTITNLPDLMQNLEKIREQGYAIDDEECDEGIRCVSAPLYDYTDSIAAAISIFGPIFDVTDERIELEMLPALLDCAKRISIRLGSTFYDVSRG